MRGYPRHINTADDLRLLATMPEYADQYKATLQALLEDAKRWDNKGEVSDEQIVTISATKPVKPAPIIGEKGVVEEPALEIGMVDFLETEDPERGVVKYYMEYGIDETAKLFRMGLTVEEVEALVGG
jgi:hypothetical protein